VGKESATSTSRWYWRNGGGEGKKKQMPMQFVSGGGVQTRMKRLYLSNERRRDTRRKLRKVDEQTKRKESGRGCELYVGRNVPGNGPFLSLRRGDKQCQRGGLN